MELVRLAKESRKNPVAEVGLSIASTSTHEQDPDMTVLGLPNLNVTEDEEMPSEIERESSSLMLAQTQSGGSSPEDSYNEYEFSSDDAIKYTSCLLYTSPSPRDRQKSRMPSSA